MYNYRICEEEFLKFGIFGNLCRHWKIVRIYTCTICDAAFERAGSLRRHKRVKHSRPRLLPRARKPRQRVRRTSSVGLDESTVAEPWNLTPPLVEKTPNSTTLVHDSNVPAGEVPTDLNIKSETTSLLKDTSPCVVNPSTMPLKKQLLNRVSSVSNSKGKRTTTKTDESVVKKTKITRRGAISRRKRSLIPGVSMNPSSSTCVDSIVVGCQSPMAVCTVTSAAVDDPGTQSPMDNIPMPVTKMCESKSTQTDFERSESPWWLQKKTMPATPMVLQTDPRLKKYKPYEDVALSGEQSKLIIDE